MSSVKHFIIIINEDNKNQTQNIFIRGSDK